MKLDYEDKMIVNGRDYNLFTRTKLSLKEIVAKMRKKNVQRKSQKTKEE